MTFEYEGPIHLSMEEGCYPVITLIQPGRDLDLANEIIETAEIKIADDGGYGWFPDTAMNKVKITVEIIEVEPPPPPPDPIVEFQGPAAPEVP